MACWLLIYILIAVNIILALFEIQIEGKDGYAKNLPCWKKETGWIVKYIMRGRTLTGYHIVLWVLMMSLYHIILFFNFNLRAELFIWGLFLASLIIEDFLWFVFNPHYGIKKFKKEYIPWHPCWLGPVPAEYYFTLIFAGLVIYFGLPGIS